MVVTLASIGASVWLKHDCPEYVTYMGWTAFGAILALFNPNGRNGKGTGNGNGNGQGNGSLPPPPTGP
jgi:hypothetical protein